MSETTTLQELGPHVWETQVERERDSLRECRNRRVVDASGLPRGDLAGLYAG